MTPDRFEELLETKGADLATWPKDERRAAERLLADSAEARAALAQARRLDDLLAGALAPEAAGPELRDAILALPVAHPREAARRPGFGFGAFWRAGLGMALAAGLAGFALGITGLVEGPKPAAAEADIVGLIYGYSGQEPRP